MRLRLTLKVLQKAESIIQNQLLKKLPIVPIGALVVNWRITGDPLS